jgi:hypothetical protein
MGKAGFLAATGWANLPFYGDCGIFVGILLVSAGNWLKPKLLHCIIAYATLLRSIRFEFR